MSGPTPRDQVKTIMSDMTSDSELREEMQSMMTDAMSGMDGMKGMDKSGVRNSSGTVTKSV